MIENAITSGIFPSAAFAVGVKNNLLVKEALGFKSVDNNGTYHNSEHADTKTLYDIASLTKVLVTTMLTITALENGKLSLHEPIGNFIINIPDDKSDLTLLHLLTHTSGLSAHINLSSYLEHDDDPINFILSRPLIKPIGAETIYSCMGFIILQRIIENVLGDSLDVLANKYIFSKLSMKDTCFKPSSKNIAATEYDYTTKKYICGEVHDENARFLGGISGNAGLFSNIDDMVRFAVMLSNKGMNDKTPYISRAGYELLIKNYTADKSESRGLGFSVYDGKVWPAGDLFSLGSYGHTGFSGTSMFIDKESGLYVILLTNRVHLGRSNVKLFDFRRRFHNLIVSEYQKHFIEI